MKTIALLFLALTLILSGCAIITPDETATPIGNPTSPATVAPATPTESPATVMPATPAPESTPTPALSAEVQAEWDKINLQTKDQWAVKNIEGWGMGFVNKETGEQIVDLPITFTDANGNNTVIHQLCYKSQTDGKGLMTVLTCMSQPRSEHRMVKISGTDEAAQKFFTWAANDQDFVNGNPQLLAALQQAANGEKPLVLVYGELDSIPPAFLKSPEEIKPLGLTAEGLPYGSTMGTTYSGKVGVFDVTLSPFERENKVFAVYYGEHEGSMDYALEKGYTGKFALFNLIREVMNNVLAMKADGYDYSYWEKTVQRLVAEVPKMMQNAGIGAEKQVLQ